MAAGNNNSKDKEVAEIDSDVMTATDFETSCSGYAYPYKHTKEKIYINQNISRDSLISKYGFLKYITFNCS